MSFILEALKKSENQRQRHVGPSLADVQVSAPREEKPWWAFAVGALLLANLSWHWSKTLIRKRGRLPDDW